MDTLKVGPATGLAQTTFEEAEGTVIGGGFIHGEPDKLLDGQLKVLHRDIASRLKRTLNAVESKAIELEISGRRRLRRVMK